MKRYIALTFALPFAIAAMAQTYTEPDTIPDDTEDLNEIVIVAQRPLVKMTADRMTYDVSHDADVKTYTLLDMLRKVPMVAVDGQDNITVNGSGNFKVYVDGKPSMLFSSNPSQIFKAMPASVVKSVEVITNPGAQYDAEGAGGVLNLVMNRGAIPGQPGGQGGSVDGYTATIAARGGNKAAGGNIYLNGQQGKLAYSASVIHNQSWIGKSTTETERTQGTETILSSATGKPHIPFTMGNLSLEYEADALTTIGASFAINHFATNSDGTASSSINSFRYRELSATSAGRLGINGSVDFSRYFGADRKHRFLFTYLISNARNNNDTENTFETAEADSPINLQPRRSDNREHTVEHVFQADLTSRLNAHNSLAYGLKASLREASSDGNFFLADILEEALSTDYDYRNRIGAAYAEYSHADDRFNAKAGMRYEHTWQFVRFRKGSGEDFDKNYGTFVPSASVSYTMSMRQNLGLTYNMRISRPGISYLNPYVDRSNPTTITYGNTDLGVEKTHNVSLVYNYFTSKLMLNATLADAHTTGGIEQYSFYGPDGLLNTTYGNIVQRNRMTVSTFVNWMPTSKTRVMLNGGVGYTDLRSNALNSRNSGWQYNAMFGVQQTLPLDLRLSGFIISASKSYTLQGWTSGYSIFSGSLSRSFLNDKLSVSVAVMTGLSKGGRMKMESFSQGRDFTARTSMSVPITNMMVGVSYTIGDFKPRTHINNNRTSDYIEQESQLQQLNGNMSMPN